MYFNRNVGSPTFPIPPTKFRVAAGLVCLEDDLSPRHLRRLRAPALRWLGLRFEEDDGVAYGDDTCILKAKP